MKRFIILLIALVLTSAAALAGFGSALKRTVVNPRFYSELVNRVDLPEVVEAAVAKITGEGGQTAQVARLAMQRLEPDIRRQTNVLFANLFDYLRGKENVFRFTYDISALQKDPEFANLVVDSLQKNEKMKSLPKIILQPVATQLIKKLPQEIDVSGVAGIKDAKLTGLRARTMIWLPKIDRYFQASLVAVIVMAAIIIFLLRDARAIAFALGISLLAAGAALLLPWLFFDQIFSDLRGPLVQLLREVNVMQGLISHFASAYVLSPIACLAAGTVSLLLGFFVFKNGEVKKN